MNPLQGPMFGSGLLGRLASVEPAPGGEDTSRISHASAFDGSIRQLALQLTTLERLSGVRPRLDEDGYYESRTAPDAASAETVEDDGVTITLIDDGVYPGSGGSIQINPFVSIDPDHEPSLIDVTITPEDSWEEVATDATLGGVGGGAAGAPGGPFSAIVGALAGAGVGIGQNVDVSLERREIPTRERDVEPDVFSRDWGLDTPIVDIVGPSDYNGNTTTQFHEGGTSAAVTRREDGGVVSTITRPDVPGAANGPRTELQVEQSPDGAVVAATETIITPTGFRIEAPSPAPVVEPEPERQTPTRRRSSMDSDGSQSNGVGSDFSSSDGDPNGGYSSPF